MSALETFIAADAPPRAAASPRPLSPISARRLTREAAALSRVIGIFRAPIPLGPPDMALVFDPLAAVDFAAASAVEATLDERPLMVALSSAAHERLSAAGGVSEGAAAEDPEIAGLAVEAALSAAFDAIEAGTGRAARVAAWGVAPTRSPEVWLGARLVDLSGAAPDARLAIGAARRDVAAFCADLALLPTAPRNDALLALEGRLRLPPVRALLAAIEALKPGDAVFDDFTFDDLRLELGGAAWRCAMADDGATTIGDADQADAADAVAGSGDPLGSAEVELTIELGRVRTPLEEARRIAPGYVLSLGGRPGPEVDLYVAGRRFGRGRLVDIEGEMGVEVLKVG